MTRMRNTGCESVSQIPALGGSYSADLRAEIARRQRLQEERNARCVDGMPAAQAEALARELQEERRVLGELHAELARETAIDE